MQNISVLNWFVLVNQLLYICHHLLLKKKTPNFSPPLVIIRTCYFCCSHKLSLDLEMSDVQSPVLTSVRFLNPAADG